MKLLAIISQNNYIYLLNDIREIILSSNKEFLDQHKYFNKGMMALLKSYYGNPD